MQKLETHCSWVEKSRAQNPFVCFLLWDSVLLGKGESPEPRPMFTFSLLRGPIVLPPPWGLSFPFWGLGLGLGLDERVRGHAPESSARPWGTALALRVFLASEWHRRAGGGASLFSVSQLVLIACRRLGWRNDLKGQLPGTKWSHSGPRIGLLKILQF